MRVKPLGRCIPSLRGAQRRSNLESRDSSGLLRFARNDGPNGGKVLCRDGAQRVADLIDDLLDEIGVVAFAHDPDHRLRA
jgi:hypothetical protein